MVDPARPWRSALYIPGAKERALDKARGLPADAIIFDLEDAVTPDAKRDARETLRGALAQGGYGPRALLVRINGADTPWGAEDLAAFADADVTGLVIPKVDGPETLDPIAAQTDLPLWAMIETPLGVINAAVIAGHSRLAGLIMGTNDLAKDLNCRARPDRLPLMGALQVALLAARAHGRVALDGVFNAFKDDDGLRAECEQGRDLGFDGKTLIHPAQLEITNQVFAPTEAEIDLARRQIEAHLEAEEKGEGVAVVDGRIVENLHVETARATLARAEAIAEMEGRE